MKRKYTYHVNKKIKEREIKYIPFRYILAMFLVVIEILSIMAIVILCAMYIPYFYLAILITDIAVVISIIASNDNPDYKVPWLLFVIVLPIVGFMLYFLFYKRKISKKTAKKIEDNKNSYAYDDDLAFAKLEQENKLAFSQAKNLCKIDDTHLYQNSKINYYVNDNKMLQAILEELKKAKKFIFLEFFIIEEGFFWDSILEVLKEKAQEGIDVKLVYDDIGCMMTLPGNYDKQLKKYKISTVQFSRLKGQADGEFNNRSHRKILVIDGRVGFTGGVNLADEYINRTIKFGHWKDSMVRIEGEAVNELTKLFLLDYYINDKKSHQIVFENYFVYDNDKKEEKGYLIPFGDGPKPIYDFNVSKTMIMNMLYQATSYVYITTPYLIVDNELMKAIENAALRNIDVRIIVPHIPDKRLVFEMTKVSYRTLIKAGVKIYEYTPGFIHAKTYISDDSVGIIGTINLDYRSLTHHFENGVWIYKDPVILDIKQDLIESMNNSLFMNEIEFKDNILFKLIRSIVRIFSPLL